MRGCVSRSELLQLSCRKRDEMRGLFGYLALVRQPQHEKKKSKSGGGGYCAVAEAINYCKPFNNRKKMRGGGGGGGGLGYVSNNEIDDPSVHNITVELYSLGCYKPSRSLEQSTFSLASSEKRGKRCRSASYRSCLLY